MAIPYKSFWLMPIGFCLFCLSFFAFSPSAQAANDPLFTVENIEIDVTSDSALKARTEAFQAAQAQAFEILTSRMLSDDELETLPAPEPGIVSTLIQDYEITKEKLSRVRYIGTYIFRFKPDAVRSYLAGQEVDYTDVASKTVLILPFYQRADKPMLWSPQNTWMAAWSAHKNTQGLVPVVVPIGDLQDISDIGGDEPLNYDPEKMDAMLMRYNAGEAVLAIALPDEEPLTTGLSIHLYRAGPDGPAYIAGLHERARGAQTTDALLHQAVKAVKRKLQKHWKEQTLVSPTQKNTLNVRVPLNNLEEWVRIQKALSYVQGVGDIRVLSLSPREAQLELNFHGDERRLRLAFAQADMTLSQPQINLFTFDHAQAPKRDDVLVYELYMGRR